MHELHSVLVRSAPLRGDWQERTVPVWLCASLHEAPAITNELHRRFLDILDSFGRHGSRRTWAAPFFLPGDRRFKVAAACHLSLCQSDCVCRLHRRSGGTHTSMPGKGQPSPSAFDCRRVCRQPDVGGRLYVLLHRAAQCVARELSERRGGSEPTKTGTGNVRLPCLGN